MRETCTHISEWVLTTKDAALQDFIQFFKSSLRPYNRLLILRLFRLYSRFHISFKCGMRTAMTVLLVFLPFYISIPISSTEGGKTK